jgi:DNA-binding NarL/FixJ family response regulator
MDELNEAVVLGDMLTDEGFMSSLTSRERDIVEMRCSGISLPDVAVAVGLPVSAVEYKIKELVKRYIG